MIIKATEKKVNNNNSKPLARINSMGLRSMQPSMTLKLNSSFLLFLSSLCRFVSACVFVALHLWNRLLLLVMSIWLVFALKVCLKWVYVLLLFISTEQSKLSVYTLSWWRFSSSFLSIASINKKITNLIRWLSSFMLLVKRATKNV